MLGLQRLTIQAKTMARAHRGELTTKQVDALNKDLEAVEFAPIMVQAQLVNPSLVGMLTEASNLDMATGESRADFYDRCYKVYKETYLRVGAQARKDLRLTS